jgi:PleD family two-component response regulator
MDYSNFSILIIDDEAPYRKFIKLVIEKNLKCQVFEAKNPKDAFVFLDENDVSLILLDMQMPIMDGLTALKILRDTIKTHDTAVIACTALSNADLLVKLFKLNISDYILKPAMEKTVISKICKVLDKVALGSIAEKSENPTVNVVPEETSKSPEGNLAEEN